MRSDDGEIKRDEAENAKDLKQTGSENGGLPPKPFVLDSEEPEEMQYKTSNKAFKLSLDGAINKIPDYTGGRRIKKGVYRAGIFAKIMFGLIIVLLSVGLALTIIFSAQDIFGMGKQSAIYLFDVAQNDGLAQIAQKLEEKGVINSAILFKGYFKVTKQEPNFQYGTYSLNSNMSYDIILSELAKYSSSREEVQVLFKEGISIYNIADLLQQNKVCSAEEFVKTLETTDFGYAFESEIGENPLRFHKLEGYMFPDTYKFFVNDSPVNVAKKMLSNYDTRITELMEKNRQLVGLSQEDVIIVASIVELESSKTEEMRKIASVYLNRLKNPGEYARLQADPTRDYANELKLQMSIIDQNVIDAYNTYEGIGLPPGPICNPGLNAIKAVLEPENTDYFYFCSNLETSEFYYAKTLEEHNENVRKAGLRQNSN